MFQRLIKILNNLKDNKDCECIAAIILDDRVEEHYVTLIKNEYIRQIISSTKEVDITNLSSFKSPILFIIMQWDKKPKEIHGFVKLQNISKNIQVYRHVIYLNSTLGKQNA